MASVSTTVPRLLVVGGNGFLGSAVCKAAVSRGWDVSSMSSSGTPYTTPAGHTPKWVSRVQWHRASAFEPDTFADLISNKTAVVHTLGILLEDAGYKAAVRSGNPLGVLKAVAQGVLGSGVDSNPLKTTAEKRRGYDAMNRDSAISVLDTMLAHPHLVDGAPSPRSFVYVSAGTGFAPVVPEGYLRSKREAEGLILQKCTPQTNVHPLIMRPGLMYHSHTRPLSTLPAFAVSLSAGLHDRLHLPLPFSEESILGKTAQTLRTHPIHVDHVADAICKSIAEGREGVVDVPTMRAWAGFDVPEGDLGAQTA